MQETVTAATAFSGEVCLPGELEAATSTLALASLAEGESRIRNVPPTIDPLVDTLRRLGGQLERTDSEVIVEGRGLKGFEQSDEVVELAGAHGAASVVIAGLAGRGGRWRVRAGSNGEGCAATLRLLSLMGVESTKSGDGVFTIEGPAEMMAATIEEDARERGLDVATELALLVAGLYGVGRTTVPSPTRKLDRADHQLGAWGVELTGSKDERGRRVVTVEAGQQMRGREVELSGDLSLASPLLTAAVSIKRSKVRIRNVVVRPESRAFLDLVRQVGGQVEIDADEAGATDLAIEGSAQLKATRVADKRAERLLGDVALLAVLGTQAQGEFLIRDIEQLRQGEYDYVAHLAETLRLLEAKVGEFPEGIIVDGGTLLQGASVDARGDAALAQALAVAGLLAHGETHIEGAEAAEETFPGFFDVLTSLKERKKK